jgi:hypothetical protein
MITPKVVPIISVTGVAGLVLCGVLAWQVQSSNGREEQRDCERAVAAREDSRAMWLYLIGEANPDRTPEEQKRFDAFVIELDLRLPPLKCEGGDWVPETDNRGDAP